MPVSAVDAEFTQDQRPREEEHGQRVEHDEDERDEIEPDRELRPRLRQSASAPHS